jgi:hypothetical protein
MASKEQGQTGTLLSYILVLLGIGVSVAALNYGGSLPDGYEDGCEEGGSEYSSECRGYSAVFRVSFALTAFFSLHAVGVAVRPSIFDRAWGLKLGLVCLIALAFYFSPAQVFNTHGYAWFARIAAAVFLVMQQMILLDIAYTWNERWVLLGEEEDDDVFNKWTVSLLVVSLSLFLCSVTGISLLFWQFSGDGCDDNNVIISFTLLFTIASTVAQLFYSSQGSLMTSAVMAIYAVFICFSAVSLNPNASCNPVLSTSASGTAVQAMGTFLTVISLSWTAYSAASSFSASPAPQANKQAKIPLLDAEFAEDDSPSESYSDETSKAFLELTTVFILISAYFAMVLTNWATYQEHSDSPDPKAGRAAMWMQAAGQWVAFLLYSWSLFAPALFPDRDFGAAVIFRS